MELRLVEAMTDILILYIQGEWIRVLTKKSPNKRESKN